MSTVKGPLKRANLDSSSCGVQGVDGLLLPPAPGYSIICVKVSITGVRYPRARVLK